MILHSDTLTGQDIRDAARVARVGFTRYGEGKSRSHAHRFEVILTGESRRHQNGGPDKAATWDQWGVFLSLLFDRDRNMVCGIVKHPVYDGRDDFDYRTDYRFDNDVTDSVLDYWPTDAHGDHTFRYAGVPFTQTCTKCTATYRWQ